MAPPPGWSMRWAIPATPRSSIRKRLSSFNQSSEGEFVGIGIQLDYETGQPVSPSRSMARRPRKAGIRSRDVIVRIDGRRNRRHEPGGGSGLAARRRGRGVDLEILRPSTGETLEFTIVRARIQITAVSLVDASEDIVALIRISQFSTGVTNELRAAIRAAKREGSNR